MIVFHGTDKECAEVIRSTGVLKGDRGLFGPGVCTTVERALNYSAIKCQKYGTRARRHGRIVILEVEADLTGASPDAKDAYTLNNEKGMPLKHVEVKVIEVLTIPKAQQWLRKFNILTS